MSTRSTSSQPRKVVYTVVERGQRSYWRPIGIAFENRDGSLNVKLDALPVNGTLQIRDADPKDNEPAEETPLQPVPHVSTLSTPNQEPVPAPA